MVPPTDIYPGNAEFICWFPEIDQGCRLLTFNPSPYTQNGDIYIWRIISLYRYLYDRFFTRNFSYKCINNTFPLNGNECCRLPEGHPYLEFGCIARLITLLI